MSACLASNTRDLMRLVTSRRHCQMSPHHPGSSHSEANQRPVLGVSGQSEARGSHVSGSKQPVTHGQLGLHSLSQHCNALCSHHAHYILTRRSILGSVCPKGYLREFKESWTDLRHSLERLDTVQWGFVQQLDRRFKKF